MKNLKKYVNSEREIELTDYFGNAHKGKIICEREINGSRKINYYYFKRNDGSEIRIFHNGFARIAERGPSKLLLTLRGSSGNYLTPEQYNPRLEFINSFKFPEIKEKQI